MLFSLTIRLPGSNDQNQLDFMNNWLNTHIQDAQYLLRKPLLITEFGKSLKYSGSGPHQRELQFQTVYYKVYASAKRGGAAAGGLFWQLLTEGMDSFRDGYEIVLSQSPTTSNMITYQCHKLYQIRKIYARMANIERWKRAKAARRAQWLARNKGKHIGHP